MSVGVSAVVCKGLLYKDSNHFKNHGAVAIQKKKNYFRVCGERSSHFW